MYLTVSMNDLPLAGAEKMLEEFAQFHALELGNAQVANMRLRTQKGLGLNDAPMDSYTEAYAKRKRAAGRQAGRRDLLFSGRMMRDLTVLSLVKRANTWVAVIGFRTEQSRLKAEGNQRHVKWFGVSRNDNMRLMRLSKERTL